MNDQFWYISGISSKPGICRFYLTVDGNPISTCYFNSSNLLIPTLPDLPNLEMDKLMKLLGYFKKQWITHTNPEELSMFEVDVATNNGAESYHAILKTIIKTHHP